MTSTTNTSTSTTTTGATADITDSFDQLRFRDAVGHYASGITIITGQDGEGPLGFTCQSFYSVSVYPPLVSFSVMRTSATYPRIRDTGTFAVNILAAGQETVSSQFARRGTDRWAGITRRTTRQGNPVLHGNLARLDCTIHAEHDAGDHIIVIGRVLQLGTTDDEKPDPLLYYQGKYRTLLPPAAAFQ
ncbi:flavin reductase family protein [Arthrobacter tumbae]|uniref:flavin reductase family protein n=1 Tax=Arthrobacter tumbae TaxID=163874 RepID=UPI00195AB76B|nr:flavin reductase family protein [Arthrobacter tumbae]MBM7782597.1 flavin reductase (DIM6/NTAB) family NADH-FMN oxidoreductase RutF [Arthrobacter tumbae]